MSDYWYGSCEKCNNDIYADENGYNVWCYTCEEDTTDKEPKIELTQTEYVKTKRKAGHGSVRG